MSFVNLQGIQYVVKKSLLLKIGFKNETFPTPKTKKMGLLQETNLVDYYVLKYRIGKEIIVNADLWHWI